MSNKDMPAIERLLIAEIQQLEKKLARQQRSDLKEFTKAALQGLCSNSSPVILDFSRENIAEIAVKFAEAALAELNKQPGGEV